MGFSESLELAHPAELAVRTRLMVGFGGRCTTLNDDNRFDFWFCIDGRNTPGFGVEVKDESAYQDSPNICIEAWQGRDRRKSGITASRAEICVHDFGNCYDLYRRAFMRRFVLREWNAARLPVRRFGDNLNRGFIVSRDTLLNRHWYDRRAKNDLCGSALWRANRTWGLQYA